MNHLQQVFLELCDNHSLWNAISREYTHKKRYYHNLDHLSNMLQQLELCKDLVHDWDCVLYALFYHDYVYKSTEKDNEEQSAEKAKSVLTSLKFPASKIDIVIEMILATKGHSVHQNSDVNYLTDADLSILGASRNDYDQYAKNVRKEYSIYPDLLYKPGRKKVLNHFLDMPVIFKTEFFKGRLEQVARENLNWELESL